MGATVIQLGESLYLERCAVGWRLLDQHPVFGARMLAAFVTRPAGRAGRETGVGQARAGTVSPGVTPRSSLSAHVDHGVGRQERVSPGVTPRSSLSDAVDAACHRL